VCSALDGAVLSAPFSGGGARSSLWSRVDTVVEELFAAGLRLHGLHRVLLVRAWA
jgi:hypothetical protein